MRQYEYRLAVIPMLEWTDQCNALGAAGWRLIHQESTVVDDVAQFLCFFEREMSPVIHGIQVVA